MGVRVGRWWRAGAVVAGVLAAVVGGAGCQDGGVRGRAGGEGAVIVVRYEEPVGADREDVAFLRGRRVVEGAAAAVAGLVEVERPVDVVVRSCGGEGASYDPETRTVELCYEEVSETRELFRRARRPDGDDEVEAVLLETVFHETAHALVDALDLRVTGREEDFADRFAALMLLDEGVSGERQLLVAAEAWRLGAEAAEDADDSGEDEHSSDRERFVDELCWVYGSAPERHRDLVGPDTLPAGRAEGCGREWAAVRDAWLTALGPALRAG
ncbi:DUF4344 domain-containing metallopeptidase [Streptomyces sp. V2]|uniref:DUF4344 domain-containing metallopeptidase n=2 Tax=Streptomyces TaxID=1883 RepID=UPI001F0C04CE|nr:DUF4344 domain-containing metallopeptidase [Streptomyces sp. V2]